MKRRVAIGISTAAFLVLAAPAVVLADPGQPGTTFPEQPGSNVGTACTAVLTNPGSGTVGVAGSHSSATAQVITMGLVADACAPWVHLEGGRVIRARHRRYSLANSSRNRAVIRAAVVASSSR
jgi:hypothetical protein